jgi:hypothetical protein
MQHNERHLELFKADSITDIADERQFIEVLGIIACNKFTVKEGFIYSYVHEGYCILWFARLDEIQRMYEITKRCIITGEPKMSYYAIEARNTALSGIDYLMYGGHFTLITIGNYIFEHGNLLFTANAAINRAIAFTNNTYYTLPLDYRFINKYFGLANPIVNSHKFKKHYAYHITKNKMYVVIGDKIRYIADSFDTELSFLCAESYDLVNVVTGKHTPTWPLKKIARGREAILAIISISSVFDYDTLYYDEKWNTYHKGAYLDIVDIVRLDGAGKATKMASIDDN